jgi:hypothetical protein
MPDERRGAGRWRRNDQIDGNTTGGSVCKDYTYRKRAWFKKSRFRVTVGILARTPIGPALMRVHSEAPVTALGGSVLREPRVPQKLQPVIVLLTRQQLRGTLADSTGVFAAQVSAVV